MLGPFHPGQLQDLLVNHMGVVPKGHTPSPSLRLVQNGVRRERAESIPAQLPARLPITPSLLQTPPGPRSYNECLLWAADSLLLWLFSCWRKDGAERVNVRCEGPLCMGGVPISEDNRALRVFLKRSKTDQFMHEGVHRLDGQRHLPCQHLPESMWPAKECL